MYPQQLQWQKENSDRAFLMTGGNEASCREHLKRKVNTTITLVQKHKSENGEEDDHQHNMHVPYILN